jgi:predicted dehydrogenase
MRNFHGYYLSEAICDGYSVLLLILWLAAPAYSEHANRKNSMKVIVIGTGSIGKRHMANLNSLGHEVFAFSERQNQGLAHELPRFVTRISDLTQLPPSAMDAAVIANRTDQHLASSLQALAFCNALYIEKPLSANLRGLEDFSSQCLVTSSVIELGFMMRYHPNLQWIKSFLQSGQLGEAIHIRASVGQWLPDWRPGTDHRQGFGAFYRNGGGVTMELIHEIDLVNWLMGEAVDVCAMMRPLPQLEIETEAISEISMRLTHGKLAQVHLDYVRPGYGRTLEVICEKGVLTWDYSTSRVMVSNSDGSTSLLNEAIGFERNNMFMDAMRYFLKRVEQPSLPPAASLDEGIQSLRVALASHQSSRERRFIRPADVSADFVL